MAGSFIVYMVVSLDFSKEPSMSSLAHQDLSNVRF
jgi:hypothetical protein